MFFKGMKPRRRFHTFETTGIPKYETKAFDFLRHETGMKPAWNQYETTQQSSPCPPPTARMANAAKATMAANDAWAAKAAK